MASPSSPLKLNFNIETSNDCKSFIFTDLTGEYSMNNITGYGSPNPELSNIVYAYLKVKNASGTEYTINLIANSSNLPTSDIYYEYNILNTDIGLTDLVTDGLWTFTYVVAFNYKETTEVYITTKSLLFTCQADCCIANLLANAKLDEQCDCNTKSLLDYVKAWATLQSLKAAARCGNIEDFNSLLKIINKICKNSECKTCK